MVTGCHPFGYLMITVRWFTLADRDTTSMVVDPDRCDPRLVGDSVTYPPPPPQWRPPPPPKRPGLSSNVIIALAIGVPLALIMLCGLGILVTTYEPPPTTTQPEAAQPVAPATTRTRPVPTPSVAPSPVIVKMPNLVGKNAAVASDELAKLGFTNVTLGSVDPNDTVVILAANWKVAEQSTPAGTDVSTDTLIVLGCTKKR